jgi:hypothetical protein
MRQLVLRTVGLVLLLAGLVVLPLPLPFGLLMIVTGLVLLIANSVWAAGVLRRARGRSPRLNAGLRRAGGRLPRSLHRVLFATDPRRKSIMVIAKDDPRRAIPRKAIS